MISLIEFKMDETIDSIEALSSLIKKTDTHLQNIKNDVKKQLEQFNMQLEYSFNIILVRGATWNHQNSQSYNVYLINKKYKKWFEINNLSNLLVPNSNYDSRQYDPHKELTDYIDIEYIFASNQTSLYDTEFLKKIKNHFPNKVILYDIFNRRGTFPQPGVNNFMIEYIVYVMLPDKLKPIYENNLFVKLTAEKEQVIQKNTSLITTNNELTLKVRDYDKITQINDKLFDEVKKLKETIAAQQKEIRSLKMELFESSTSNLTVGAAESNKDPIKEEGDKYKKKAIPKRIRDIVWDEFIGRDKRSGPCFTCGETIDITNFHAGHMVAERNGGETSINNLRPVCAACNLSMGKMPMDDFKNMIKSIRNIDIDDKMRTTKANDDMLINLD